MKKKKSFVWFSYSLGYQPFFLFFFPFFWVENFTQMLKMQIFLLHITYSLLFLGENFHQIPKKISSSFLTKFPKKFGFFFFFFFFWVSWNHGNHCTLFFFNTHECQETRIKNQFDSILGFGLVRYLWKWNFLLLNNDIFYKGFSKVSYNKSKLMIKHMRW
jgi:hypothetical protein